ncbi:MAG TPA: EamA family transporter RarD [Actinomycetales bacterium]|nr:EamA family transporter RarD [Actinomycetales bacterium]
MSVSRGAPDIVASIGEGAGARTSPDPGSVRNGTAFGLSAYLLWGVFPLYLHLLLPANALEILLHRMVWSLAFCVIALALIRDVHWVRPLLRHPGRLLKLGVAAVMIATNWGVYIYAVNSGHVVEAALGYFLNPIVTVLLGVLWLGERLRPLQWCAVALGLVAAVVLTVDYGRPPWVALVLALSFATYGLMKKRIGVGLGALASLSTETALLFPLAVGALVWLELNGQGTFTSEGTGHTLLLASTGIATAVPLLLFAAAARRIPLVTIGLLQFLTPVLQLLCGVLLMGEVVPPSRWVGFGIVWVALVVLTLDSLRAAHGVRLARAAEGAAA